MVVLSPLSGLIVRYIRNAQVARMGKVGIRALHSVSNSC